MRLGLGMNAKITEIWYKSGKPTDRGQVANQHHGQSFRRSESFEGPLDMSPDEMLQRLRHIARRADLSGTHAEGF